MSEKHIDESDHGRFFPRPSEEGIDLGRAQCVASAHCVALMCTACRRESAARGSMHPPDALDRDVDDAEENCARAHRPEKECRPKPGNDPESSEHEVDGG